MKAFIFAAGLGTRLKPWTDFHPKALAEIDGIPVIKKVIDNICNSTGISDFIVNLHHFPEQIISYLNTEYQDSEISLSFSDETSKLLDTGGALLKAAQIIDNDDLLVHNCDILHNCNLNSLIEHHYAMHHDATLLVKKRESTRCFLFDHGMNLKGWINKKTHEQKPPNILNTEADLKALPFCGVHVMSKRVLYLLKKYSKNIENDVFSITPFYLWARDYLTIKGYEYPMPYDWIDIGTDERLRIASLIFKLHD